MEQNLCALRVPRCWGRWAIRSVRGGRGVRPRTLWPPLYVYRTLELPSPPSCSCVCVVAACAVFELFDAWGRGQRSVAADDEAIVESYTLEC